jgi:hypothetical protein
LYLLLVECTEQLLDSDTPGSFCVAAQQKNTANQPEPPHSLATLPTFATPSALRAAVNIACYFRADHSRQFSQGDP